MDALRSWDAPEDARPVIAIDFEVDDDDNGVPKPGSVEKAFRGQRGTVRLDLDGQVITDPTLADQALAELTGIPTRGVLPLDRVDPPPRAGRPRPRRGRAPRPPPGVDQRRRSRHVARQATAREGHLRAEDAGRRRTRAGSRSPRTTSPGSAASSSRASSPWPSSSATATRSPASKERRAASRGGPRRAAGAAREGSPGRAPDGRARRRPGAVRAVPHRRQGRPRSSPASTQSTPRRIRCPSSTRSSAGCASSTRGSAS